MDIDLGSFNCDSSLDYDKPHSVQYVTQN